MAKTCEKLVQEGKFFKHLKALKALNLSNQQNVLFGIARLQSFIYKETEKKIPSNFDLTIF